jgi:hypothetical protein
MTMRWTQTRGLVQREFKKQIWILTLAHIRVRVGEKLTKNRN